MPEIVLRIESLAHGGAGVGHSDQGKAVFVDGTAPGDIVRAEIVENKASYARARLVAIEQPSPDRTEERCALTSVCGGCHWQHISYENQLLAKRQSVVSALARIGKAGQEAAEKLIAPCVACKREIGYRNKLELSCTTDAKGKLLLGLHARNSGDITAVASCPLAHKALINAPKALQGALRFLEGTSDLGIFRVGIRQSVRTKALEVALWTSAGSFPRAAAAKTIAAAIPATSIVRIIADSGPSRKVKNVEVLSGAGHWTEELGGFTYAVSAPSFFQVNTPQAEKLQELVLEGVSAQHGGLVADLYSGVGTFTIPLARAFGFVIAVESSGPAVRDLRRNAEKAHANIEVVGGDSARELPALGRLDALVVDPPRAGLADGVAESIAQASPRRLVYVSCEPATWARDVGRLAACGYRLLSATPVDLFPQTYHVETVSVFERD